MFNFEIKMKKFTLIIGMLFLTLASFGQYAEIVATQLGGPAMGKRTFHIKIIYADSIVSFSDTTYEALEVKRIDLQPKVIEALNFMDRKGWDFVFEYAILDEWVINEEHYLFKKKEE